MAESLTTIASLVRANEKEILPVWLTLQKESGVLKTGRVSTPKRWKRRSA
jgi:hypothetical protein